MERVIRNAVLQLISGAVVGTLLDQAFPHPRASISMGDTIQQFIEVTGQLGLLVVLSDAFAKTFSVSLTGQTVLDTIPFVMAVYGFSGNMIAKMHYLGAGSVNYWKNFTLTQSVPPTPIDMTDRTTKLVEQTSAVPTTNDIPVQDPFDATH